MTEDNEDSVTTNDNTRWVGLSTFIAGSLVTSFIGSLMAHALGIMDIGAIPEMAYTVYIGLVLAACYYSLGEQAVDNGTDKVMEDK